MKSPDPVERARAEERERAALLCERRAEEHERKRASSLNADQHEGAELALLATAAALRESGPRVAALACETCAGAGKLCVHGNPPDVCSEVYPEERPCDEHPSGAPREPTDCPACEGRGAVLALDAP